MGSAARKTWLSGDHDLDIFIGVPEDASLEDALKLAREVAPEHEERYAEHAYVHALFEGFELDLVPCYLVMDASRIKSAVDRTPFHSRYVSERIGGLEDEVLLLKQFMKGIGVYGSELKVGGFSGYLAELLVIRYGSFPEVLRKAAVWQPGEVIDLEGHSIRSHQDPLVVVDPVDPKRNVAAALTLDRMFQFAAASRCFLKSPEIEFFFPPEICPLTDEELLSLIEVRESTLVLIEFATPDLVEDVVFPQLRKAEQSVRSLLDRNGFSVLRSDVDRHQRSECGDEAGSGGIAWMIFELEVGRLSSVRRRIGPPVWEAAHVEKFVSRHPDPLSGPYVEDGKVVVEAARRYTDPSQLIRARIEALSLGKHLTPQFKRGYNRGYKIYVGKELLRIEDPEFRKFAARYFSARQRVC